LESLRAGEFKNVLYFTALRNARKDQSNDQMYMNFAKRV
jgi:hypothetical protein